MNKKQRTHNLHLLQSADMFSGQFRSLDMIAVDLVSEFQIVHAPDKSSFDSPPVKAAPRYTQGNFYASTSNNDRTTNY